MKVVVGLTGMPGSGKSIAIEAAKQLGYSAVVMGDFVRREAEHRDMKPNAHNLGRLMLQMRREKGEVAIAKLTIPAVKRLSRSRIMIDGIRSLPEVEEFRKHFPMLRLVAVHAPQRLRFQRIVNRSRRDDVTSWRRFRERDLRELEVGLGSAIALADWVVANRSTLEEFKIQVRRTLEQIEDEVQAEG